MKTGKPIDRRKLLHDLIKGGAGAAFALEQLGGVPLLGTLASDFWRDHIVRGLGRFDAFQMMNEALRGGPALLGVHQAMAQAEDSWTLVQIKILNHVSVPMVFKMGKLDGTTVTTGPNVPMVTSRMSVAKTSLITQGIDEISDQERYRNLRLNRWFANILHFGTTDGKAAAAGNLAGLEAGDVKELDADKVALQTFIAPLQIEQNNHALKGCKLRSSLADITLFAAENGLIASPLGISCFMMGGKYEAAEGAVPKNAVLGSGGGEKIVVGSRTVAAYVGQIRQYVGKSYADRAAIEQNVIYRMDKLVNDDPVLRRDLVNSIVQFQSGLGSLMSCGDLEIKRQTLVPDQANSQTVQGQTQGASGEFLAQCKYVAASMDLPGVPVRNFSLFLSATDLDGRDLDDAQSKDSGPDVWGLSYVESMRQLAMGLNVIGKKIAEGKKIIVIVQSEGGRSLNTQDDTIGFCMVLGPKGAGLLDDAVYANMETINQESNNVIIGMGGGGTALPWTGEVLKEANGSNADKNTVPTTGDVGMGVLDFLEEKTGSSVVSKLPGTDGRHVKLKRG